MRTIHPKTGGAATFGTFAVLVIAVLNSISGVHVPADLGTAITAFLSALGAFLTPAADTPAVPSPPAETPAVRADAPPETPSRQDVAAP